MIKFLLGQKLFLLVSFLFASIVFLPHVVTPVFLPKGSSYSPFSLSTQSSQMEFEEMYAYASEAQAFVRERSPFGDVHTFEYRQSRSPSLGELFPSVVYGSLTLVTGSIESAFVIGDFIFPFLISLLLLRFTKMLVKNSYQSIFTTLLIIFFWSLIYYLPYPIQTLEYVFGWPIPDTILVGRAFNPQIPFMLLLLFLNLFFAKRPKLFWAGIAAGIMFYTYVFYWQMCLVFLGIWIVVLMCKRKQLSDILPVVKVLFIALLIALPYLVNSYLFAESVLATDFLLRTTLPLDGVIPGFFWRYLGILTLFALLLRKEKANAGIVICLLVSCLAAVAISSLLLQRDLENFHYIRRWFFPFSIVLLVQVANTFVTKPKIKAILASNNKPVLVTIFAVLLFVATLNQLRLAYALKDDKTISHSRDELYRWINKNTGTNDVVGSLDVVESLAVTSYTGRFIYLPPGDRTIVSTRENIERAFYLGRLSGVSEGQILAMLNNQDNNFPGNERFSSHVLGFRLTNYPKNLIKAISSEKCRPEAKIDYILVTPKIKDFVKVSGTVAYRNSDYLVYNISNEKSNNIRRCPILQHR